MSHMNCVCNRSNCQCTLGAIIIALIISILTAFLQLTAAITVTTTFLWVVLGIATVYLAVLIIAAALSRHSTNNNCVCSATNTLLIGIAGSILVSTVLLGFGIVATSAINAILVGLLLGFLSLTVGASACFVKAISDCN